MIARLGLRISAVFRRTAPDPFVLAILLTALTAALALAFGAFKVNGEPAATLAQRATALLDAWRAPDGLWRFLAFGMQMCLILVTGHALASSKPVRAAINALAALPRSTAAAAATVGLAAAATGLINWGLGLIVGALLAREVGRAFAARNTPLHYPLICAAGYMGLLVWHGGLSGSAPLTTTTRAQLAQVFPGDAMQRFGDQVVSPLNATIFSPMNFFVTGGLLLLIPLTLYLLAPRRADQMQTPELWRAHESANPAPTPAPNQNDDAHETTLPDRMERSWVLAWLLAIPLLIALARYARVSGLGAVGLNEVNATMLGLGLLLHGSPRSYTRAVDDAARGCGGIIIQFPLYAGIMAMMAAAGLVTMIAGGMARIGGETATPILTFFSAALVNLFVPSGGGQWGIQGPIAVEAGLAAGVEPAKMVMAVAYGDQLTNMLQPFWALPLLAITGVKARDIVGYTAVVMTVAAAWMLLGLLIF